MQLQVMNSPFNQEQAELLNRLLPTLTESQKIWLSGYLAAASPNPVKQPHPLLRFLQKARQSQEK